MYTAIVEWPGVPGYEEVDVPFAKSAVEAWKEAEKILGHDYQDGWIVVGIMTPTRIIRSIPS